MSPLNLALIGHAVSEKKKFENNGHIYTCIYLALIGQVSEEKVFENGWQTTDGRQSMGIL